MEGFNRVANQKGKRLVHQGLLSPRKTSPLRQRARGTSSLSPDLEKKCINTSYPSLGTGNKTEAPFQVPSEVA